MMLTQARLKELIHYDPDTGMFRSLVNYGPRKRIPPGPIGVIAKDYVRIMIESKPYCAHRIAWLYMTGRWPEHEIDHKDRNPFNNKWRNLREATRSQNNVNRTTTVDGRLKWAYQRASGRWVALKRGPNGQEYLGTFDTEIEAHQAAAARAIELHGEFAR